MLKFKEIKFILLHLCLKLLRKNPLWILKIFISTNIFSTLKLQKYKNNNLHLNNCKGKWMKVCYN